MGLWRIIGHISSRCHRDCSHILCHPVKMLRQSRNVEHSYLICFAWCRLNSEERGFNAGNVNKLGRRLWKNSQKVHTLTMVPISLSFRSSWCWSLARWWQTRTCLRLLSRCLLLGLITHNVWMSLPSEGGGCQGPGQPLDSCGSACVSKLNINWTQYSVLVSGHAHLG